MWATLNTLGLTEGKVLEPGCGSGNFIGSAPDGIDMTGVEIDPTTAAITAHLYPEADIRRESFSHTSITPDTYDAAIGNVPFSNTRLYDPTWNPGKRFSLHSHFVRKAVGGLHDGGVVALLTSRYTMDSRNPAVRAELAGEADLLGAIRLPSKAHQRTAGTDVITDVLFLRKRPAGEPATDATREWINATPIDVGQDPRPVLINNYFQKHPEFVLGRMERSTWRDNAITVEADNLAELPQQFAAAASAIATQAVAEGKTFTPLDAAAQQARDERITAAAQRLIPGTVIETAPGEFAQVGAAGERDPLAVPKNAQAEMRSLMELRDTLSSLMAEQASSLTDSPEAVELRTQARSQWEAYTARYGAVNRYTVTWRNKQVKDEETGETSTVRVSRHTFPKAITKLSADPAFVNVRAAEKFNDDTQAAEPADILTRRTVVSERPLLGADTAEEALNLAIDATGRADLDTIAQRLGADTETTRAELGDLVFDSPDTEEIITRAEYLSGNVRTKLDAAEAKLAADPDGPWQRNVDALRAVIPEDVDMSEIEARIGAVWITTEDYRTFFAETVGDEDVAIAHPGPGYWDVRTAAGNRRTIEAVSEWGTEERPAHDLFKSLLKNAEIRVERTDVDIDGNETKVLDPEATEAAREKAEALQERFSEWVWEDPDRATRLHQAYNRQFNSLVARDYTEEGKRLTLPGLVADFTPADHQRTAVARIVAEPAVGLFHQVGAGKTAAMVMGMTELKRRGLVNKPMAVVPNHMLEQFTREWKQLYPTANLLAADSDTLKTTNGAQGRRTFIAQAAMSDWDGILITQSAFERIGVSEATLRTYTEAQTAQLEETLRNMQEDPNIESKRTERDIQNSIRSLDARLEEKLAKVDENGLDFEAMGVDYLAVDEFHLYKNLNTPSRIQDAAINGSGRASDMEMKIDYLRRTYGERVITAATGTPVANSITEAHVMMRYLRPDLLKETGVANFDDWAATFGETVSRIERDAAGRLRSKERFSKFKNVPEMLGTWQQFADVKMAEDLNLPTPDLALNSDGERRPEYQIIPRSKAVEEYMHDIERRLDDLKGKRPEKGSDNYLTVYGDGRKAALDPRLVGLRTGEFVKLNAVAENVAQIWAANRDNTYIDPSTGDTSEKTGALQLIFCDLSTPKQGEWSAYFQLRQDLSSRYGMDASRIRYIHEARNNEEKAEIFNQARSGDIDVLIGSSERMGTGANIQARAIALHHVDCPWRPAELTQRDGRILRRGNQNDEVRVIRYATENTFDSTSWDTITRKSTAIQQLMRGRIDVRELEDPGDMALDAQQLMAASSGNPLLLQRIELDNKVTKLARRERAHNRQETTLRAQLDATQKELTYATAAAPILADLASRTTDTTGEAFVATVNGTRFTSRTDATDALIGQVVRDMGGSVAYYLQAKTVDNAVELGGHTFGYTIEQRPRTTASIRFTMDGSDLSGTWFDVRATELTGSEKPRLMVLLENRAKALGENAERMNERITSAQSTIESIERNLGKPFKYEQELREARTKLAELGEKMAAQASDEPQRSEQGSEQASSNGVKPPPAVNRGSEQASIDAYTAAARGLPDTDWDKHRRLAQAAANEGLTAIVRAEDMNADGEAMNYQTVFLRDPQSNDPEAVAAYEQWIENDPYLEVDMGDYAGETTDLAGWRPPKYGIDGPMGGSIEYEFFSPHDPQGGQFGWPTPLENSPHVEDVEQFGNEKHQELGRSTPWVPSGDARGSYRSPHREENKEQAEALKRRGFSADHIARLTGIGKSPTDPLAGKKTSSPTDRKPVNRSTPRTNSSHSERHLEP